MAASLGDGRGVLFFLSKSAVAKLPLQGLLCLCLSDGFSAATTVCRHRFLFVFFRGIDMVLHRLVRPGSGRVGWSRPLICSVAILMDVRGGSMVGGIDGLFQMLSSGVVQVDGPGLSAILESMNSS